MDKPMRLLVASLILLFSSVSSVLADNTRHITIVKSIDSDVYGFEQRIITNTKQLLAGDYKLIFKVLDGGVDDVQAILKAEQSSPQTDIIITTGLLASQALISQKRYAKPSIAGLMIDERLQGVTPASNGTSGINNLTYVKSQYDLESDLALFREIIPFKSLGILVDTAIRTPEQLRLVSTIFDALVGKDNYRLIGAKPDEPINLPTDLANPIDAVYVLPLLSQSKDQIKQTMQQLIDNKLPSFAMIGRAYVELGSMAGKNSSDYIELYSRRIALDVMKILKGQNPANLSVDVSKLPEDFVINDATLKSIGLYPDYDILETANIINQVQETGELLTLRLAIDDALKNNLQIKQAKIKAERTANEIASAKRAFLPSLDVAAQLTQLDDYSAQNSGSKLSSNLSLSAQQILYSEQALGTYKARKLTYSSELEALKTQELDTVQSVLETYVQYLTAKRQLNSQNENVQLTRKNLEVAKQKQKTGYSGLTDVYRLESQLAQNQAQLNTALANVKIAKLRMQTLLNRKHSEAIGLSDIEQPLKFTMLADQRLFDTITDDEKGEKYVQFLIDEAMASRPSLLQIGYSVKSQQRLLKSEKRQRYIPTVSLSAGVNDIIKQHNAVRTLEDDALDPAWNVNLNVSLPLFSPQRSPTIKNYQFTLQDLAVQRDALMSEINFGIRSGMETAVASYQQNELYRVSADNAEKNYKLISEYYKQGKVTITDLIDAQNNALTTKLNSLNAEQQFLVDFLKIERSIGSYYFMLTPEKQNAFVERFINLLD